MCAKTDDWIIQYMAKFFHWGILPKGQTLLKMVITRAFAYQ